MAAETQTMVFEAFAGDVDPETAAVMAATQRTRTSLWLRPQAMSTTPAGPTSGRSPTAEPIHPVS